MTASSAPSRKGHALSAAGGTALHHQVFMVLRDEIQRGVHVPEQALPTEESLCKRFGVSRITVRRALADLSSLGFVERRQGVGNFARGVAPSARRRPTPSLLDGLRQTATHSKVTVLGVEQSVPPASVATVLQLPRGAKAVHATRVRSVDGAPVMLVECWVPVALGKRLTATALRKRPLYEILLEQGVVFGRVVQELSAVVADPIRAQHLRSDVGSPLVKLARLMCGQDSEPVAYLEICFSSEQTRFVMDIAADQIDTINAGQLVHDRSLFIG